VLISSLSIGPNGLFAESLGACTHILQSVSARTLLPAALFFLLASRIWAGRDAQRICWLNPIFFKINALQV
jgi:hypothetical protein